MKIALLFPGYGSQFVGMGKDLYDEYRIVQEYFEEASNCLNSNFVKLCFASSDSELRKLVNAYTSLFLVGCSTYALLKEFGIEPNLVAGYNNGEYAALFAAGCFSLPDGLYLLNKFCSFYQMFIDDSDVNTMLITKYNVIDIQKKSKKINKKNPSPTIALYNDEKSCVVSGHSDALSELEMMLIDEAKTEYIGPEVGLHSSVMDPVVGMFRSYLEKVDFKDLKIPFLSSVDGKVITQSAHIKQKVIDFIHSPLYFSSVVDGLHDYDCILIATPGDGINKLLMESYQDKTIISLTRNADIEKLKEIVRKNSTNPM